MKITKKPSKTKVNKDRDHVQTIVNLIDRLTAKYGDPIGEGYDRVVFNAGNWVVKVPGSTWSYRANYVEESYGHRSCDNPCVATCRLFHIDGVPVLWMEKVVPVTKFTGLPKWCDGVDGYQVGYNRQGKLVAYDYGNW